MNASPTPSAESALSWASRAASLVGVSRSWRSGSAVGRVPVDGTHDLASRSGRKEMSTP